jgi:hypothetical protein
MPTTRQQFGRRSAGGNAIPDGAPAWVVRSILESRAAMARGEYREMAVSQPKNVAGPMVRAVYGPQPQSESHVDLLVEQRQQNRSGKKKWTGPSAADLDGLAKFREREDAAEIARQQNFLNSILS